MTFAHHAVDRVFFCRETASDGIIEHARICFLVLGSPRDPVLGTFLSIHESNRVDSEVHNSEGVLADAIQIQYYVSISIVEWKELVIPSGEKLSLRISDSSTQSLLHEFRSSLEISALSKRYSSLVMIQSPEIRPRHLLHKGCGYVSER